MPVQHEVILNSDSPSMEADLSPVACMLKPKVRYRHSTSCVLRRFIAAPKNIVCTDCLLGEELPSAQRLAQHILFLYLPRFV